MSLNRDHLHPIEIAGKTISGTHAVEPSDASRRFRVEFRRPVVWQCVDESYTTWSDDEERDDTSYLQALTNSPYLDYVMANHGWHCELAGPSTHYRLCTADEVIDVIAFEAPTVSIVDHAE